jgi:hypothetical protein
VDDRWRRSDEHHRNLTFDVADALNVLRDNGSTRIVVPLSATKSSPRAWSC